MCEGRKNTIPLLKLRDIQNQRRGDEGQEDEWRGKKRNGKKRLKKKKKKKERGGKKVERSLQAVGTSPMNDATYARVYVYRLSKWIVPMRCYIRPRSPLASFTSLLLMTTLRAGFRVGRYSRIIYSKYLSKIIVRTKSVQLYSHQLSG